MSSHASRTIAPNIIREPVVRRTASIPSLNSYRLVRSGESPTRFSKSTRRESRDRNSNVQVSSKTNSIEPQAANRKPSKGSSTRINVHSRENAITPSSVSTRSVVSSSRHLENTKNAAAWSIIDLPKFTPFAAWPHFIQAAIARAKSPSLPPQPSPGSRAKTNARGKNYSVQNAKRKRLSNSPVSLKKRS